VRPAHPPGALRAGRMTGWVSIRCCCFLPDWAFCSRPCARWPCGGLMSLMAFGGETHLLKCALSFLTISAVFGGGVWAASMLVTGAPPGDRSAEPAHLLFSFAVCWALLSLTLSLRMRGQGGTDAGAAGACGQKARSSPPAGHRQRPAGQLSGRRVLAVGAEAVQDLFTPDELAALRETDGARALMAWPAGGRSPLPSGAVQRPGSRQRPDPRLHSRRTLDRRPAKPD
jgi:hypothetical protein